MLLSNSSHPVGGVLVSHALGPQRKRTPLLLLKEESRGNVEDALLLGGARKSGPHSACIPRDEGRILTEAERPASQEGGA